MASIGKDKGGKKRVLFVAPDGKRKTVYLGKCSMRDAESFKTRIESLLSALIQGREPGRDDAEWVARISPQLRQRLAKVGLIQLPDVERIPSIGEWIEEYIKGRTDIKPRTVANLEVSARSLFDFWGKDGLITEFTAQDGANLRIHMLGKGLAEATVRRRCKRCKQFFTAAIKKRLISENPFDDVPTAGRVNKDRQEYVSTEKIETVLEACPNLRWRLIFALSRYGGLRIPSELKGLTFDDILWDKMKFIVHSPKTEHVEGKESRIVPLFPELVPYLREALEQAKPGQKQVVPITSKRDCNLGTQGRRIIKRAGLEPWKKTFHNLRASRQTDLVETYPDHVVAAWLGNSVEIAKKHYLQVTEEHFERAVKAAQNPAQYLQESTGNDSQEKRLIEALKVLSPDTYETLREVAKSFIKSDLHRLPPRRLELLLPG